MARPEENDAADETHPGVHVEDLSSGVRTKAMVSTATTAFVDFFGKGPVDRPIAVDDFEAFTRHYDGLHSRSEASYALWQYFLNGGRRAFVVRVAPRAVTATATLVGGTNPILRVDAIDPGRWGNEVQVGVEPVAGGAHPLFNLVVRRIRNERGQTHVVASESHLDLTMVEHGARYAPAAVNSVSQLVHVTDLGFQAGATARTQPSQTTAGISSATVIDDADSGFTRLTNGADGLRPAAAQLTAALPLLDLLLPQTFNLMCIPRMASLDNVPTTPRAVALITAATAFCRERRAFLLVDPPANVALAGRRRDRASVAQMVTWMNLPAVAASRDPSNAIFFPPLSIADPLVDGRSRRVAPSGTVAGIYARTDSERGVWKAAAGRDAQIRGAEIVAPPLTDADTSALTAVSVNVLRSFPALGNVVWGARTGAGGAQDASEWMYVPVRRTALHIQQSLLQGLQWVVFEPNDERLWAQIRLHVDAFMQALFRDGAFQGRTAREAFVVHCDRTTTTQPDIDDGVVNVRVGFAPLRAGEFVVIPIQLTAREAA